MAGEFNPLDMISQITASTNRSNAAIQGGMQALSGINDSMTKLLTTSQTEKAGAIVDSAAVAAEKAGIDYERNSMLERIQKIYRMDESQPNYAVAEDMAAYEKTRNARVAVRQQYDELASTDMLSNPLGWIFAQAQLPQVAAQNNALADREDEALQDIRVRNELLGATKSNALANTADAIKTNQLNDVAARAREANANLAREGAQNLALLSANKLQQIQLQDKIGDNERQAMGLVMSAEAAAEARRARKEQWEAGTEQRELIKMQLKDTIAKKAKEEKFRTELDARFQTISNTMGLAVPMTVDRWEKLPDKEKVSWYDAAQSSGFGSGLNDSVSFFRQKNNLQGTENASLQGVAKRLDTSGARFAPQVQAAVQAADPLGKTKLTDDQLRDRTYQVYKDLMVTSMSDDGKGKEDLSAGRWDGIYNVYVAPFTSFSKAIDTQPGLAPMKTNLVKQQIDVLNAAGSVRGENLTADQQQQVLAAIQNKVMTREITSKQAAAEISTYFQAASKFNLGMNKYNLFGLPEQKNYMFTPEGSTKIDMFDPAQVENSIVRSIKDRTSLANYNPVFGMH